MKLIYFASYLKYGHAIVDHKWFEVLAKSNVIKITEIIFD